MVNESLSLLSPEAQAVITKACAYCDLPLAKCEECANPEPKAEEKINIASGEDVYA